MNTPGVVGILALQALAAFAVVAFFRRNPARRGEGRLRTLVAPAAAAVLLTVITVLVCTRLNLFTGAGPAVNWTLVALTPVVFPIGGCSSPRGSAAPGPRSTPSSPPPTSTPCDRRRPLRGREIRDGACRARGGVDSRDTARAG